MHIPFVLLIAICLLMSCGSGSGLSEQETKAESGQFSNYSDSVILFDGLHLLRQNKYDSARALLLKSAQSDNVYIKAESFLYLNALEMQLENYDKARLYLEKYHDEAIKLFQKAVDAQEEIYKYKTKIDLSVELMHKQHNRLVWGIIAAVVLMIASGYILRVRHKAVSNETEKREKQKKEQRSEYLFPDPAEYKRYLISAEIFKQTAIYSEIAELAGQEKNRYTKILNTSRQRELDAKLSEIFREFISDIKESYPLLTDNDIKLCCLSLLPLTTFAKALCFGSTENNIIKQRKHQIKKKMGGYEGGPVLFEFIFAVRQDSGTPL